jgi:ABC-type transport system involved in multi-copper enzyme maturation permease subunit
MSLLRAELRRLTKRRITRWMLVLVLLLMPAVALIVAANHVKPGPAAVAQAEAEAAQQFREQERWIEQDIERCEEAHESGDTDEMGWPEDCEEIRQWQPTEEEMVEWFMPPAFDFRDGFPDMILVLTGLLGLFAFIVGASYVGAEWRTGGMMNLLLWRPRRLQVLGTKLAAVLGSLTGLTVVLGAAWTGMFWLVAEFRGITDTMTAGAWQSFGLTGLRALVLVLAAGAVGFALASVGRHTAMAMGTAIGAFVLGIAGVSIIAGGMLQLSFFERYLWATYVYAWLDKSTVLTDWNAPCESTGPFGECVSPTMEITWQDSGIGMGVALAAVLVVAMLQMRQRDVT